MFASRNAWNEYTSVSGSSSNNINTQYSLRFVLPSFIIIINLDQYIRFAYLFYVYFVSHFCLRVYICVCVCIMRVFLLCVSLYIQQYTHVRISIYYWANALKHHLPVGLCLHLAFAVYFSLSLSYTSDFLRQQIKIRSSSTTSSSLLLSSSLSSYFGRSLSAALVEANGNKRILWLLLRARNLI